MVAQYMVMIIYTITFLEFDCNYSTTIEFKQISWIH